MLLLAKIKKFVKYILKVSRYFFDIIRKIIYKIYLELHPQFKSFVTVSKIGINGRLGNQLFQYAIAKSYSMKNNVPLILPNSEYNRIKEFKLNCTFVDKYYLDIIDKVEYVEKDWFIFNNVVFKKHNRFDLNGFFQNEKYFIDIRQELLNEIKPKNQNIINYCEKYLNKLKSQSFQKSIVALHIRRGDYVPSKKKYTDHRLGIFQPTMNLYHPLLDIRYFEKAKSYFINSVFLVFSDTNKDIEWCENNLNDDNTYFSKNHDDITDLMLMANCDHNIISNSSFSWWAAWLNQNPKKVVIAPKIWLGDSYSHHDTKDLIPKTWTIVK